MTGLRALLIDMFPDVNAVNFIQGQQNNTPMPPGPNFVVMIPAERNQLATTTRDYDPTDGLRVTTRSTQSGVQLNFYGPGSTDFAQVFTTLFRDLYGCDFLKAYGIQPLWCDDGRQMPLVSGEEQYIERWMVRTLLQINPAISTKQDFAAIVDIKLVEADSGS
jgi:hypothetical protein